jgi:hypothetical protein
LATLEAFSAFWLGLPFRWKALSFALLILVIELGLRYGAPKSAAFARWQAFFKAVGAVWTTVLLSLIYLLSVGPISVAMRLFAKDLLDRELTPEPTLWRPHEPNPLGPEAAARRQF